MAETAANHPKLARYWVIMFAVTLAIICYVDRVCISQAAPLIVKELDLTQVEMGYAFAAFAWAYGLFEIPSGWLGDWIGPKKVLIRIVIWWSLFTAATGWVWSYGSLLAARFLFGAGEAGCFPNLTKLFTTWLSPDERVKAQGILWMSARWGGAITPYIVALILEHVSWRSTFLLFGSLGIIWAIFFYWWHKDNPQGHKSTNSPEAALLQGGELSGHWDVPWRKILASRAVWLLSIQYFCLAYGWSFYITWLPTYLQQARGVGLQQSGLLAGLVLFLGGLGSLSSGLISTRLAQWIGSVVKTRRSIAYIGFCGSSVFLMLSIYVSDPILAMVVMGMASFATDLVVPGSWGACMDIGGKCSGTISGFMNTMSCVAGGIAPVVNGYILQLTGQNWNLTFYVAAAIYLIGAFCWTSLDPVTPLGEPQLKGGAGHFSPREESWAHPKADM